MDVHCLCPPSGLVSIGSKLMSNQRIKISFQPFFPQDSLSTENNTVSTSVSLHPTTPGPMLCSLCSAHANPAALSSRFDPHNPPVRGIWDSMG